MSDAYGKGLCPTLFLQASAVYPVAEDLTKERQQGEDCERVMTITSKGESKPKAERESRCMRNHHNIRFYVKMVT